MGPGSHVELKLDGGTLPALVESILDAGAVARLEVSGSSMLPLIRTGDAVRLRQSGDDGFRAGMVVAVLCDAGRNLVVHRVARRQDDELLVRGDNTKAPDGKFVARDVLGVVTSVERDGRSVWFGAGRLGPLVAFAVRHGLIWRFNRLYYGLRRRAGRCLKFAQADTRLRERKGDDWNE